MSLLSRRRRWLSPLTWRILAVNLLASIILTAGLFYIDQYEQAILASELHSLRVTCELTAAAIAEGETVVYTVLRDQAEDETTSRPAAEAVDVGAGLKVVSPRSTCPPLPCRPPQKKRRGTACPSSFPFLPIASMPIRRSRWSSASRLWHGYGCVCSITMEPF
ncbi:MAG: two-component system OmpR family sensor histidine kinase ChvG [Rhodospirillaceae bacterium]|nr:MAG: two-component system OmpR family sensor histidine kinase ChvG [Rhodospirillaceae bacterium]